MGMHARRVWGAVFGAVLLALGHGAWAAASDSLTPLTPAEQVAKADATTLLDAEHQAMMRGDRESLHRLFLPDSGAARAAEKTAWERGEYWRAWAKARGVHWVGLDIRVRTPGIDFVSPDRIRMFVVVQERYRYRYDDAPETAQFGIGTRHYAFQMVREGGRWYIANDDASNRVTERTMPSPPGKASAASVPGASTAQEASPGAARAIAYADRYCGSAPGCGGGDGWRGRYHPGYRNFNGDGGDCTNFISQVLHAGGLRENDTWNYDRSTSEGSRPWSNADGLAFYLMGSGRAVRYRTGTYDAVSGPEGVGRLRLGDLVSYVEDGTVVHTGVVVAFDPHGVPLTDTHTNDRFHAPWEYGWKNATVYWLWHVNYPVPPPADPQAQTTNKGTEGASRTLRLDALGDPTSEAGVKH